jgi:hypothetical protein
MFSESFLAEHGAFDDENSGFVTKLAGGLHKRSELLGKKARNADESVIGDNFLCLKVWVSQLQELESMLLQEPSQTACSFGLSATSQQYFSLRTNQPPAISQQYFSLRTNQHQPSATSQTNRLRDLERCCSRLWKGSQEKDRGEAGSCLVHLFVCCFFFFCLPP